MGFSEYVGLLRVKRACDLLSDTDKKISRHLGRCRLFDDSFLQPRFCAAYEHDADSVPKDAQRRSGQRIEVVNAHFGALHGRFAMLG